LDVLRPDEAAPVVLVVSASELNQKAGELRREIEMGAVVRIDDVHRKVVVGWLSADPPASVRSVLHHLPEPGTVNDHLARDLEALR
jgi:hypothetical protein